MIVTTSFLWLIPSFNLIFHIFCSFLFPTKFKIVSIPNAWGATEALRSRGVITTDHITNQANDWDEIDNWD